MSLLQFHDFDFTISALDVKVKDVEKCEIVPGVELKATFSSGSTNTFFTSAFDTPEVLKDCHNFKTKLTATKSGFCPVIEEVKRKELATQKDLLLRKHQGKLLELIKGAQNLSV